MKFQNPSLNFILNGRTHTRTDARTDGQASRNQYAPHFFKIGSIKIRFPKSSENLKKRYDERDLVS